MPPRVAIATTTIFPLDFLGAYVDNVKRFGRERQVAIYVAGDRKSPSGCGEAASAASRDGVETHFLSIDEQHRYLERFEDLAAIIPENSDNRRNVAFLRALEDGADVVISIDDDNYCLPEVDFVGEHLCVGEAATLPTAVGDAGWFNACALLEAEPAGGRLFPRGFPYSRRSDAAGTVGGSETGVVAVNAGLWLLDPDTDAIGRLHDRPSVHGWNGSSVLVPRDVRSPVNTQNTALTRRAMAAYYYVRMGVPVRGLTLDRFGDILSGYFVQVVAAAVGEHVRFGGPIVEHRRHAHDLLQDLYHELAGIMMLEDLADFFATVQLPGDDYVAGYRTLSHELERFAAGREGFVWTDETRRYLAEVGGYMRIWADVVDALG